MLDFAEFLKTTTLRFNELLQQTLSNTGDEKTTLDSAVRYVLTMGGKRLRPALIYATAEALGVALTVVDNAALATEILHNYSLVHDDLPQMDNDTLRRGQPTCHVVYGVPNAILTGDTLQSLAFAILSAPNLVGPTAAQSLQIINVLANAIGNNGMAGGQCKDLEATGLALDIAALTELHQMKTGRLFEACVEIPIIVAGLTDTELATNLRVYARSIGILFQVQDDILDVVSVSSVLGKSVGKDLQQKKETFPSLLGLEGAKDHANALFIQAMQALDNIPTPMVKLKLLAEYFAKRVH